MTDDLISRQAVLKQLKVYLTGGEIEYNYVKIHIDSIPPVNPQEPEMGHWIEVHPLQEDDGGAYMCSECKCGGLVWKPTTYCPNCGAKMVEPQESEETDADIN